MKIERINFQTNRDGTLPNGQGAVETDGVIRMCNDHDNYFITIAAPRDENGVVTVLKATFDNKSEMEEFFTFYQLYAS